MEILIFLIIAAGLSCLFHLFIKNYWLAVIISPPAISLLFVIFDWVHGGYIDIRFFFTFVLALFFTFIASAIIGIPFALARKDRREKPTAQLD